MIVLHRLGHLHEELHLNPDLIESVEGHPDTVVTLVTERRLVVAETVEDVLEAVREYRVDILSAALKRAA
jgi:flagellar protein FlbD